MVIQSDMECNIWYGMNMFGDKININMSESYSSVHYAISTLSMCASEGQSCASEIFEIVVAGIIMIWLVFEFVMQVKSHLKIQFSWQEVMLVQIFLCLCFNIFFQIWSTILIWYILQSLFFHFYFTTLVYYVCKKYLEKKVSQDKRLFYTISLIILYALFCLAQLGIFVYMVNAGLSHCKQLSEIIVCSIMIALSIALLVVVYLNETEEIHKFDEFEVNKAGLNNPLKSIWFWIIMNIVGQITSLIESVLIYSFYNGQQCYIVQNNLENDILNPIFMVLSYGISFCSTLYFYQMKRHQQDQYTRRGSLELSAQMDNENRLELLRTSNADTSSLNSVYLRLA